MWYHCKGDCQKTPHMRNDFFHTAMKTKPNKGYTMVELAIVLVVIGLLLGGILKGQELINNAKVRAIADRQNSLKLAWFSFIDRFAAMPGDYALASDYINGAANGNGNGIVLAKESPLVFQHLTSAGYLRCPQCTETATDSTPGPENSLTNMYDGVMSIHHNSEYAARMADPSNPVIYDRLLIVSGGGIPSNIIAEIDRKIDDGAPNAGDFVFNEYMPAGYFAKPSSQNCMRSDAKGKTPTPSLYETAVQYWRPANATPPVEANCQASLFL